MQMYVGCPNYFIYSDGGLKEILLVTSTVRKAAVYLLGFICSIPWHSVQMPKGQITIYCGFFSNYAEKEGKAYP